MTGMNGMKKKLVNFDNAFHSIHTDSALYFSFPPSFSPSFLPSFLPSLLPALPHFLSPRVYFTPNRALSGLALVGLPGTEGQLHIVADSQIRGTKVKLLVPFKLAQCPLGYYDPPTVSTIEEVNDEIGC